MPFRMNSRGQEFAGFKLLIGAITSLLILVIIVGIITHIESLKFEISEKQLYEGLNAAVQTPDGTQIVRKDLTLQQGSLYSASALATISGLPEACISISSSRSGGFEISGTDKIMKIKTNLVADIYYKCTKSDPVCDISCEISFGEEI